VDHSFGRFGWEKAATFRAVAAPCIVIAENGGIFALISAPPRRREGLASWLAEPVTAAECP
jgi:hypothetical protein